MNAADFLQALFSGCGGLAVCMSHKGKTQGMASAWFTVEEGMPAALLEETARQDAKGRDAYFSVCPAKKIPSTNADRCRVRKQDVACIPAYFMDVDTQEDPAKAGKRVPQSIAAAVEAIITGAANQAADLAEAKPSTLFLGAVRELLAINAAQLRDLTCRTQEYIPPENMAGYQDERMVYLIPGVIYSMARRHLEGRGAFLPIGAPELWRHLRDEKLIQPDKKNNPTRNKFIDGKAQRLLWVHRTSLDVPEE